MNSNELEQTSELKRKILTPRRIVIMILIFFLGVLLIFSSYAWFSTSLNVKIKEFNMIVSKNSGLTISFDAINFDHAVELSKEILIDDLKETYPNHVNQWANNGLVPVSTIGNKDKGSYFFDVYATSGVRYHSKKKDNGYITSRKVEEKVPRGYNNYIAFDIFLRNATGSPVADNLYFDEGTSVFMTSDSDEEMQGLVNSLRIGIVKVGTLPLDANPKDIQNLTCQGSCDAIIFEPNSKAHTMLSRERAAKYDLDLRDEERFPTYAMIKDGGPIYVANNISGSPKLDYNYFALQNTMYEEDFDKPLFTVPNGITKARVYVWIEGQDIDSLETDSSGADLYIDINFIKDTLGYETFD